VLVGASPAETMPPLMGHLATARLVVVDPRRTLTAERALASGGLHLQPQPGTDLALTLGMLHAAVNDGYVDKEYLAARTTGFDDVWRVAAQWWPERADRVCGVAAADMSATVRWLGESRPPCNRIGRDSARWCGGSKRRCPRVSGGCPSPDTCWSCAGRPCWSTASCARSHPLRWRCCEPLRIGQAASYPAPSYWLPCPAAVATNTRSRPA